jgi:hypothetical protein
MEADVADVFLSYKREDKARAKAIATGIEAHGYSVFYDAEIDVGQAWNQRIVSEIAQARCVAVLWSEHSSDMGVGEWVHNEAREGKKRDILAPALIGDCEIPLEFSAVQAADLRAWRGDPADQQWRNFIERLGACVQRAPKNLRAQPWRRRSARIAAALVVFGVLIGGGVYAVMQLAPAGGAGGGGASTAPRIPDALAQSILADEWAKYFNAGNCPTMLSWSAQYVAEYPDWEVSRVARDQAARACPQMTVADATEELRADAPVTGGEAAPFADLLSRLRATDPAPLTDAQIAEGAARMGVEPAVIRAIMWIQSGRATGFNSDGHPSINFEHHVFSRLTGNRFDGRASGVSSRTFVPGTYARPQAGRWQLLEEAYGLDANAALSATGWGRFRILGMNYEACGFNSLEAFVLAQARSEEDQLRAFEAFVRAQGMLDELQAKDWQGFARRFYGSTRFAGDLEGAYRRFAGASAQ